MPNATYYAVSSDYFRAAGTRLVRGRTFGEADNATSPRVAIIGETFARQHFAGEDPIGKRINIAHGPDAWREIVGIVADVTETGIDRKPSSQMYEPFVQNPNRYFNAVVRSTGPLPALLPSLRAAVYGVDKDQPVGSVWPLAQLLNESIAPRRFAMLLVGILAVVALLISAVGIYGVTAYTVAQRTGEFGIRMAVGAQRADVLRLVLWQGGKLACVGLLLGIGTVLAGSRLMASLLFETSPHDPFTLVAITLILAAVALLACLLPARRAMNINPIDALRAD
jgi:putative ABC transport system permease protein